MRTYDEHIEWCKQRAMEYLNRGDLVNAVASMTSDLNKHNGTRNINAYILLLGAMRAQEQDADGVRRWIEGFR
jgi:hypothetical protein